MIIYKDNKYRFYEFFNEKNGTLVRSNIIGTKQDADMRSFPELIDIGIMGHCMSGEAGICAKSGIDCYQSAVGFKRSNMPIENYEMILKQCQGKTFQVALGGAGDPNKHDKFSEILALTRHYGIIPNITTSGFEISSEEIENIKRYCGAAAVSYYSRLNEKKEETNPDTLKCIKKILNKNCITNIHYVISTETIDEAIYRLQYDVFPRGINAIIFILYKPVGLGKVEKKLRWDGKLQHFLDIAIKEKHPYRVGFDTCFTSALIHYDNYLSTMSIDACEAAKFSMYIDCEMNAYPCSFDNQKGEYRVSLRENSLVNVWNSIIFENFRNNVKSKCERCSKINMCKGGCKLDLDIELCGK